MNKIYTWLMSWLMGEAVANSDRIRLAVAGAITTVLVQVVAHCQVCGAFLTPEVTTWISGTIAGYVVVLILALTKRDIAAPGETVDGAAVPLPELPVK